jgi:CHAT domain-containing protein
VVLKLAAIMAGGAIRVPLAADDPEQLLREAQHYAEVGNLDRAGPLFADAEKLFHAQGDTRNELFAKFGRLRRDVESGSYVEVQQQLAADLKNPVVAADPALKLRALAVKGIIDLNLDTVAARQDWTEISQIATKLGDRIWQNRAEGELAIIAGVEGDLPKAGLGLWRAIQTASKLGDVGGELSFRTWLGNGLAVNKLADRAIPILDDALALAHRTPDTGLPLQTYIAKIRALRLLPEAQREKGRKEARKLLAETLAYARANKILGGEAELLNQAGLLAQDEHDLAVAQKYFEETVSVSQKAELPRMAAEGSLHLADVLQDRGKLKEADAVIDFAIDALRRVEETMDLPLYLAKKAEIQVALGAFRTADAVYAEAERVVDGMLQAMRGSRLKTPLIATMSDIYTGHFRLALAQLHSVPLAFRIVETARGRALADAMRSPAPPSSDFGAPGREIARIQMQLRRGVPASQLPVLLASLEKQEAALAPIEYKSSWRDVQALRSAPVGLGALRRDLLPNERLLEYVLDSPASYCVEVGRGAVRVHTLPARADIDAAVQRFLTAIRQKTDAANPAKLLFRQLVEPALADHPESLIIVPDGDLHLVPFAALIDDRGRHLVQSAAIAYSPSATVLHLLRARRRPRTPRLFLGVAFSPEQAGDNARAYLANATRGLFDLAGGTLRPLPFAQEEVLTAVGFFKQGGAVLVGANATETNLKAEPLEDFRIIHFAVHAVGNNAEPDRAALVLAPGGKDEDGLWQVREIRLRHRFGADLITLSACDTGVGRMQGEEGILSLARTFLMTGAGSVVASLWEADDRFSADLMQRFYAHIAGGDEIAPALREAQLDILKDFGKRAQPYYWASFTVIGNGAKRIAVQTASSDRKTANGHFR